MRQRYDSATKFVTLGYPKPFAGHILEYPNLVVLEALATEQMIEQRLPEGIMQESPFFQEYVKEAEERGLERGLERGEKIGTINSILTLLSDQFQNEAVQALKPRLEAIENLEQLEELLRAVPRAQSLEAFTQNLQTS